MSRKKGLSLEEKRTRMLEYFHEKKDFFLLKDLEKDVPKAKGIIQQSVKDVVISLVNDNLVVSEKIGTSTFYWAFPSTAKLAKKQQLDSLRARLEDANKRLKAAREKIIAAKVGREETEKRLQVLQRLHTMKDDEDRLNLDIKKYKDSDPEKFEKMMKEIQIAKTAANRWTDNIYLIKTWCKDKCGKTEEELDKAFEIPSDFEYLD